MMEVSKTRVAQTPAAAPLKFLYHFVIILNRDIYVFQYR